MKRGISKDDINRPINAKLMSNYKGLNRNDNKLPFTLWGKRDMLSGGINIEILCFTDSHT